MKHEKKHFPDSGGGDSASTPTATPEPQEVLSNACMSIDGVYVDDSWSDGDNSPLRMVYLLYTLTANDTNLQIDSKYTKMTINGSKSFMLHGYLLRCPAACRSPGRISPPGRSGGRRRGSGRGRPQACRRWSRIWP